VSIFSQASTARAVLEIMNNATATNTVPNLDAMTSDELRTFWGRYHRPTRKDAAALVGHTRKGYAGIASLLANYAINKCAAMRYRRDGDVQGALRYEEACELHYARIPADLRW
jgi:hypothetical protein